MVYTSKLKLFAKSKNELFHWAIGVQDQVRQCFDKLSKEEETAENATDTQTQLLIINDPYTHVDDLVRHLGTDLLVEHLADDMISYGTPKNDVDIHRKIGNSTKITGSILSILKSVTENGSTATELGEMAEKARESFPQTSFDDFGKLLDSVPQPSISPEETIIAKDLRRVFMDQWDHWDEDMPRRIEAAIDGQSGLLNGRLSILVTADEHSDSDVSASPAQSLYDGQGGSGASASSR